MSSEVTELSWRNNGFFSVSQEMLLWLQKDGLYLVTPEQPISPTATAAFSQWLLNPKPVGATGCYGETRDSAGEGDGLRGLHQSRTQLLQLHLGQDT